VNAARGEVMRNEERRQAEIKRISEIRGLPINEAVDALQKVTDDQRKKLDRMGSAIENLSKKMGRPGAGDFDLGSTDREQAIKLCAIKHEQRQPKSEPEQVFIASEDQIAEATLAIKGMRNLLHTTSLEALPLDQRKAMTSFSLGSSGFILRLR
jgi:hypothetical protein